MSEPTRKTLRLLRPLPLLVAVTLSSCSWSFNDLNPALHNSSDVNVSYQQLRLRMRSLVDPMGGEIERAADKIRATHDDPAIQRAALEWKAQGVPALRESLFQPEPMTALFDTWVLLHQMETFYQSGEGAAAMGSASSTAAETCRRMERDYHQVVVDFTKSGDVRKARDFARKWADQHPIKGSIAHRESTLTRADEVDLPDEFSATDAIADITLTVDDLNRRLEIYSDQAVRQARWEAQLLTMDLSEQLELDQAVPLAGEAVNQVASLSGSVGEVADSVDELATSVARIVPIVDRLAEVAETTPELIATERAHAIKAAQDEITRALEVLIKERETALEFVSEERSAALETLHETVIAEREILTRDLEDISTGIVDHAFTRVVQLVIGLLVAVVVILLVGLFLIRRMISELLIEKQRAT